MGNQSMTTSQFSLRGSLPDEDSRLSQLLLIILSKIDENRCKQTVASLP